MKVPYFPSSPSQTKLIALFSFPTFCSFIKVAGLPGDAPILLVLPLCSADQFTGKNCQINITHFSSLPSCHDVPDYCRMRWALAQCFIKLHRAKKADEATVSGIKVEAPRLQGFLTSIISKTCKNSLPSTRPENVPITCTALLAYFVLMHWALFCRALLYILPNRLAPPHNDAPPPIETTAAQEPKTIKLFLW